MAFLACYFSATRPYESENCSTMEAARQADEIIPIEQFSLSEGLVQKLEGGIDLTYSALRKFDVCLRRIMRKFGESSRCF